MPGILREGGVGRLLSLWGLFGLLMSASAASAQNPPLVDAAARGDLAAVETLLAAGAPVDGRDARGRTALLAAAHANHPTIAVALIAAGADVNVKDAIQDSAFLYAAAEGRVEILKLALAAGADLASTNRYGGTALIPAAHHGHVEAVRILLDTDIDVDHINNLGWTALIEAVILGDGGPVHTEIVRLLVEAGAQVELGDSDGVTPLEHAKRRGFTAMEAILAAASPR